MHGFKALALLITSSLVAAVPVAQDTSPKVHGTSLKDLTVDVAGTSHNVPRASGVEGLTGLVSGLTDGKTEAHTRRFIEGLDGILGGVGGGNHGVGARSSVLDGILAVLGGVSHDEEGVGRRFAPSGIADVATGGADVNGIKLPTSVPGVALPGRRDVPAAPEVDTSAADGAPAPPETKVDQPQAKTLPEIFQGAIIRVTPIIARLKASVAVKADIDVDVVVFVLNQLIVVLGEVVVELQFIIDNPVPVVLGFAGSILSLPHVAFVIASLVWLVATGLYVVVLAVATVSVTATATVNPLVVQIGDLLAHILTLAITLAGGVVPLLAEALAPVVHLLWYLHLGQVAAVVGISAPN